MGKLERIDQLAAHGLNTPRLMLIKVGSAFDDELRQRMRDVAAGDTLMTVRTYHPSDEITYAKGPFAPEIPTAKAMRIARQYSRDWHVLFQEAIDVGETVIAGNVALSADGTGRYEALAGEYRVREVEDPPPGAGSAIRQAAFADPRQIAEPAIRETVERLLESGIVDAANGSVRMLFEFNVQQRPVGRRREPILFWEWRPLPGGGSETIRPTQRVRRATAVEVVGIGVDELPGVPPSDGLDAVLGGKGAGLARACDAKLPVPPTIVLTAIHDVAETLSRSWRPELEGALPALARAARTFFGDASERPIAVRSSPSVSMPGMLTTVLGVAPDVGDVGRAIGEVLRSWTSERARLYRSTHGIREDDGLAIVLQPMVLATYGSVAGSGVGFTRNPATGADHAEIEFVEREWGTSLVSGNALPITTASFTSRWPQLYRDVSEWCLRLERVAGDMQEFEFAIEDGRAYLLQMRRAKRTPGAALRVAHDLLRAGIVDAGHAKQLLANVGVEHLTQRRLCVNGSSPIGCGRVASPGVAQGRAAFDRRGLERIARDGDDVVLLSTVPAPEHYPLLRRAAAVVSSRGGVTSHASVVALDAGIVAVVGCEELEIDPGVARFGDIIVREGDWVSIDAVGARGAVFAGRLALSDVATLPDGLSSEVVSWAQSLAQVS